MLKTQVKTSNTRQQLAFAFGNVDPLFEIGLQRQRIAARKLI